MIISESAAPSSVFNKDDVMDARAMAVRANAVQDDEGNSNAFGSTLR